MIPDQRIDQWLWFARFFKSRTIATKMCSQNGVRINRNKAKKASSTIKIGDILTFPQGRNIRVVRVIAIGKRRGPSSEALKLYEDLTPTSTNKDSTKGTFQTSQGNGRPTKRERRALDRMRYTTG